jgi:cytohesin
MAQQLLEAGADPAQAGCAYLPLLIACERGDQDTVAELIAAGADVNLADNLHSRETPLHRAAYHGHAQVTQQLLAAGANPNATSADGTPLHYAAAHGHTDTLAALLAAGADVNAPDFLKRTPLHQAAANGQLDAAQALLAAGADVSLADESWGWTPLCDAAHYGQVEIVRLLLDAGADPLATDKYGNTPRALAGPMQQIRAAPRPASCDDVIALLKSRGG